MYSCSAISTDTPGRVDKSAVLQTLQASGESYDNARETLKQVSVDSSGKLELEDFVEVRACFLCICRNVLIRTIAECQATARKVNAFDKGGQSHGKRI